MSGERSRCVCADGVCKEGEGGENKGHFSKVP